MQKKSAGKKGQTSNKKNINNEDQDSRYLFLQEIG